MLFTVRPSQPAGRRRRHGRGGVPALVVHPRVFGQMVGPREPFVAHVTPVRLDARVRATVPGQLVGPGKTPRAARPHAAVGLLA